MKKNLGLSLLIIVFLVGAFILIVSYPVKSAQGNDLTVELSAEDYAILQKQLGLKQAFISQRICNQDICNFTIKLFTKDGERQESFLVQSTYLNVSCDKNGECTEEKLNYDPKTFDVVSIDLVKDYLLNKIVDPQKEKEKEKQDYLFIPGGELIIKEGK